MDKAKQRQALELVVDFLQQKGQSVLKDWQGVFASEEGATGMDTIAKGAADVVTKYDREIEQEFHQLVTENFPEMGFRGEEFPELNIEKDSNWLIDPIDGTKYFAVGAALWCMTAALVDKEGPVLGAVYIPYTGQIFTAIRGEGAFLNGMCLRQLDEDNQKSIADTQISWDQSAAFGKLDGDRKSELLEFNAKLQTEFYRARIIGSGTLSVLYSALGVYGGYVDIFRPIDKYVDLAAAELVATESGLVSEKINRAKDTDAYIIGRADVVAKVKELAGFVA